MKRSNGRVTDFTFINAARRSNAAATGTRGLRSFGCTTGSERTIYGATRCWLHRTRRKALGIGLSVGLLLPGAAVAAGTPVTLAYQPEGNWGAIFYTAIHKGFFKEVGLQVKSAIFQSGAPEVAAGASGSWQIGGMGDLPAFTGAAHYGLQTIAFADRESKGNVLVATAGLAKEVESDPNALKNQIVVWPENSTGQWAAEECLSKKYHLNPTEYHAVNLSPGAINSALASGRYHVAGTFAPYQFLLEAKTGSKIICNAHTVGLHITSNLLVDPSFGKAHPEVVARFLAAYLHTVAWATAHPKKFYKIAGASFALVGDELSMKNIVLSITQRHFLPLAEELTTFNSTGDIANSDAAKWMESVNSFAKQVHMVDREVPVTSYMTARYLKLVENNPALKKFADEGDATFAAH